MGNVYHIPAMLRETIEGLNIQSGGTYVDVTFGGGGHSRAIMAALGEQGRLGRIFVPSVYRKILNEAESKCIVMRRDTDNECLIFYPEQVWNEKVGQLREALDEWDPEDQMLLMQFMSDAEFLDMDNQGRILLQKKNLEAIGVQQDVLFVGMLDRFALWSPEKFAEKRLDGKDLASRIRRKMKG